MRYNDLALDATAIYVMVCNIPSKAPILLNKAKKRANGKADHLKIFIKQSHLIPTLQNKKF